MASAFSFAVVYLAIWIIITVAWWAFRAERHGISGLPFYIIYRTTRLNNWIGRISSVSPRAWRTIWDLGILTGVGSMAFIIYQLGKNLLNLSFRTEQAVSVQPIVPLPGLFVSFETFPYLVLALSIVVASHELSHGIASLVDRVPLKSTGAFFAHVLMGGFVEPDEEKLNQAKNVTKLRVFAAGSFTNVVLGILCVFLLFNFPATIAPFYDVVGSGVQIGSIPTNLPAYSSELRANDIVTSINATKIAGLEDLRQYMSNVTPGQVVVIGTQRGSFPVKTGADQNNSTRAIIGISDLTDYVLYNPKIPFLSSDFPNVLLHAEFWLSIVLVSVALINMLPMYPFDGDKFLETILSIFGVQKTKPIRTVANVAAYSLLILNIGLSFVRFGFLRY
jgi:membrane-associated protease RseP (regulator of RpoE activity)